MADDIDFIDLYGKLRLEPGCSLEDFKRAYRRNVALWHPDRRRGSRADVLAAARLQRLTVQYGAAMEFHRRHGRLPGTPLSTRVAESALASVETGPPASPDPAPEPHRSPIPVRGHAPRWWFLAVGVVSAAVAWSLWPTDLPPDVETGQAVIPRLGKGAVEAPMLSLGMTPEEVVAIQGEPLRRGDERWEYGPSWVRFEHGSLIDWYSSPLAALRVASVRPRP
ncbi:J domain-containing protein [Luteibacter sp. NPDC031894]|uniref:J domain-containing protein n=1 Tax=Luteibacter sp. NPDC031894 TaxID=3390572 RepID=UPI003D08D7EF